MNSSLANPFRLVARGALVLGLFAISTGPSAAAEINRPQPLAAVVEPIPPRPPRPPTPPAMDPSTGLPIPSVPWKDPEWSETDRVLPEFRSDGVPLSEVARHLRKEYREMFDVIIPNTWSDPLNSGVTFSPGNVSVYMELKNVRSSEAFNAMNLVFDAENTACRWELRMNGNRPTAILRVVPERLGPSHTTPPDRPTTRVVYFVGDLLTGDQPPSQQMEQLASNISEVYRLSYGSNQSLKKNELQYHLPSQLLIVTGTDEQVGFVQQILAALREKARTEAPARHTNKIPTAPVPPPREPKPPPDGGKP